MNEDFLWVEKYRPKTIEDTILPADLKVIFQQFVDQKNIPNLILSGSAGVGKTTVARAMLEQLDCDYIVINGSMNGNIDTLRNDILNFASTVSFAGGRKYVILDEADYLNANSTQPALRNFMEEFSRNCGFILTCNFKNRIIDPLHSRCSVVDFKISKRDMAKLAGQFFKRVESILGNEGIAYDKSVVAEIIQTHFPDWRRVLNELQRYSATGKIDSGILANLQQTSIRELIDFMKLKNYTEVRKWVKNNIDSDVNVLYNEFYDTASQFFTPRCIPLLVTLIAKYQYQNAFAANTEINFAAFLAEAMVELEFV
ncbi:MAG: sliding clamp loader [Caudoviricetes sp.]|nr:MAG: sliding clamp loader [Caudoviricetes sp.]